MDRKCIVEKSQISLVRQSWFNIKNILNPSFDDLISFKSFNEIPNTFSGISIVSYFVVSAISSRSTKAIQSNPNEEGIQSGNKI